MAANARVALRLLPWWHGSTTAARQELGERLRFARVFGNDGEGASLGRRLREASARPDLEVHLLAEGCFAAAAASSSSRVSRVVPVGGGGAANSREDEVTEETNTSTASGSVNVVWQLNPPPVLRALLSTGVCSEQDYWRRALAEPPQQLPGVALLLFLRPSRAAFGVLHCEKWAANGQRKDAPLQEHKVITTYAVRGGEKCGTGKFQLFEDARDGGASRSEGAKLRRRNAIRFFEKINEKLCEWREASRGQGWPPFAVFFAGDQRLRRLLLDCRKPRCPLPEEKQRWIQLQGTHSTAVPSLEVLERAARALCVGEVVEVRPATDGGGDGGNEGP